MDTWVKSEVDPMEQMSRDVILVVLETVGKPMSVPDIICAANRLRVLEKWPTSVTHEFTVSWACHRLNMEGKLCQPDPGVYALKEQIYNKDGSPKLRMLDD